MRNTITLDSVRRYMDAHDWCQYQGPNTWYVQDCAASYGEPGYHSDGPILLGDWWLRGHRGKVDAQGRPELEHFERVYPRLTERLEELGIELVWEDEWTIDHENGSKAYRTSGDCYGWTPSTAYMDGGILTPDDDIEAWIDYARNNASVAINDRQVPELRSKLEELGWTRVPPGGSLDRFQNGWHPGQTDDPKVIAQDLYRERGKDIDIVFQITSVGQFDIDFVAWWIDPNEESDDDE